MELSEKDKILKICQDITRNIPVIILGSGVSMELGMTGMQDLQKIIFDDIDSFDLEQKLKDSLKYNILNYGLEAGLSKTTEIINNEKFLNKIVNIVWDIIYNKDTEFFKKILMNDEKIPLEKVLNYYRGKTSKLNIITTNYDRLTEYAVDRCANFVLYRGFPNSFYSNFNQDKRLDIRYSSNRASLTKVHLLKVHGSIDWFEKYGNQVSFNPVYNTSHKKMIITPGLNKHHMAYTEPFRSLMADSDKILKESRTFLCIGFGFNDSHVQEHIERKIKEKDTSIIVIAKKLTDNVFRLFKQSNTKADFCLLEEGDNTESTKIYLQYKGTSSEYKIDNLKIWNLSGFAKTVLEG